MKEQFPERVQFLFGLYFINIYVHKHTDMPNNGSSYSAPTHTGIHAANILFSSWQETISELTLQLAGKERKAVYSSASNLIPRWSQEDISNLFNWISSSLNMGIVGGVVGLAWF